MIDYSSLEPHCFVHLTIGGIEKVAPKNNSYLGAKKICTCKITCLETKHSMFSLKTMPKLVYLFK
jgi:hypothetical protein